MQFYHRHSPRKRGFPRGEGADGVGGTEGPPRGGARPVAEIDPEVADTRRQKISGASCSQGGAASHPLMCPTFNGP